MIPFGAFLVVPVIRCGVCDQEMPADHVCPSAFAAFIADPYGSPSDIDHP